jgi:hypothetical protein
MEDPVIRCGAVHIKYLIGYGAVSSGAFVSILRCLLRSTIVPFCTLLIVLDHCFLPFPKQYVFLLFLNTGRYSPQFDYMN